MTIWHHRQIFIKFGSFFGYSRWRISFSLYHSVSVRFASFASPYFSYPNKIFNQLVILWLAFPNEATTFFEELKQQILRAVPLDIRCLSTFRTCSHHENISCVDISLKAKNEQNLFEKDVSFVLRALHWKWKQYFNLLT